MILHLFNSIILLLKRMIIIIIIQSRFGESSESRHTFQNFAIFIYLYFKNFIHSFEKVRKRLRERERERTRAGSGTNRFLLIREPYGGLNPRTLAS